MSIILLLQEVYGILGDYIDEIINNADVTSDDNAPSFKYKAKNQRNKQKAFRWPFKILKSLELMFLNIYQNYQS